MVLCNQFRCVCVISRRLLLWHSNTNMWPNGKHWLMWTRRVNVTQCGLIFNTWTLNEERILWTKSSLNRCVHTHTHTHRPKLAINIKLSEFQFRNLEFKQIFYWKLIFVLGRAGMHLKNNKTISRFPYFLAAMLTRVSRVTEMLGQIESNPSRKKVANSDTNTSCSQSIEKFDSCNLS